ncbi:MAG: hypothetical protein WC862_00835 [Patescibacteria group bacterium]
MNQTSDPTIKDVMEVVEFIRDNAATKDDVQAVRAELQKEIQDAKNETIGHIDGFVKLHKDMDTEIAALKSSYQRHEEQISQIVRHLGLQLSNG